MRSTTAASSAAGTVALLLLSLGAANAQETEGQWTCVFRQSAGNYRENADWLSFNPNDQTADFSILDQLENFRQPSGAFTMKIVWPNRAAPNYNTWRQTSNPVTADPGGVTGYEAVDIHFTSNFWGGLEKSPHAATLIDGSVNHNNWFYAVGTRQAWGGGMPGAQDAENQVELWVETGWVLLFRQTAGNYRENADWLSFNPNDQTADFSILDQLENFRQPDGAFTMKIVWPNRAAPNYNTWRQTSNPVTADPGGVDGYEAVDVHFTSNFWGGLEKSQAGTTLIDGSVNHGNWFYAVGTRAAWGPGIPGAQDPENQVELWALPQWRPPLTWLCIFRQSAGNYRENADWLSFNPNDQTADFSILDQLENFRQPSGAFTMKIVWPNRAAPNYNTWRQTSNPVTADPGGVDGYEAVDIHFTSHFWGGLEKSPNAATLIDGSVNHGNWFYAVGTRAAWGAGIPGAHDAETQVELWVEAEHASLGCEPGQYDHDDDPSTDCLVCAAGSATDTQDERGATSCTACANGHYDNDSESTTPCVACAPGAFATSTSCTVCLAGETDLDSDPTTPCDACSVGTHSDEGSTTCLACTAGTADTDSDPSTPCVSCDPGSYAASEATTCVHCAAGYVDSDSDPSTPCDSTDEHLCAAGTYAPAGSTQCTECAAGLADLDSDPSTPCSQCSSGHEQTTTGQASCTPCAAGTADTDEDASTACAVCEAGQYAPQASIVCAACPSGEADVDSDPATACSPCPSGTHAPQAATDCTTCAAGTFDGDYDPSTPCAHCPAGSFGPLGATSCEDCVAGSRDDDLDPSTPCITCPGGSFAPLAATTCVSCTPGWTDSDNNPGTACTKCPAGSYNDATGRDGDCDLCAAGQYLPTMGSSDTECLQCSLGEFAGNGSATCSPCSSGTADEDADPATPCTPCPVGTQATCGAIECELCPAGMSDVDLDPATPCADCGAGQYAEDGAGIPEIGMSYTICTACPLGTADLDYDSTTSCTSCPAGTYAGGGSTACDSCEQAGATDHDDDASTPCFLIGGGEDPQGAETCDQYGDLNGDGHVGTDDLLDLLASFGRSCGSSGSVGR
eukprot:COSAG06_NODE_763_length_12486_cov_37.835244_4_plen_1077_part_00